MKGALLLLFISHWFASAQTIALDQVRILYQKSATEETTCKQLVSTLAQFNELNNPTLAAYKACTTMMMSTYILNPFNKLSNFNEGRLLLEKCIGSDPQNLEIRFLRYTVQRNSPWFLNYKNAIQSDKAYILKSLNTLEDSQLKELIFSSLDLPDSYVSVEYK